MKVVKGWHRAGNEGGVGEGVGCGMKIGCGKVKAELNGWGPGFQITYGA